MLIGDVEDAICLHAFYYAIWKRYGALPERYNWQLQAPDVPFYPLRPELVESTYLLYQVLDLLELTAYFGKSDFIQEVTLSTAGSRPAKTGCLWICLFLYIGLYLGTGLLCNVVAMLFD